MGPYLKYVAILLIRQILRLGYLFPVKRNKVLFSAYEGLQYTCNPKYIFERLFEECGNRYEYVWVLNDRAHLPAEYRGSVNVVSFLSLRHLYHLLTAGVIISNVGIDPFLPKRRQQKFINTWHGGGAYKRVSSEMNELSRAERYCARKLRDIRSRYTDCFLSSCRSFTEAASHDFAIRLEAILPCGMPRNDRFFHVDKEQVEMRRHRFCGIHIVPSGNLLVLYAPTFRGSYRHQRYIEDHICCSEVADALKKRFGKDVTFLVRRHISADNAGMTPEQENVAVVDVTGVPDMQDLIEVSDVLITDYSSAIWDFALTGKPGFVFVPDLDEYQYNRGFYTPIDKWPYPYAESVGELCRMIELHDDDQIGKRIKVHQHELGSYENGSATEQVIDIVKIASNHK